MASREVTVNVLGIDSLRATLANALSEIDRLKGLTRTVALYGTGFIYEPPGGERLELRPDYVTVVIGAEQQTEIERLRHYTSTACHHGLHESCGKAQHDRGEDGVPHCKFCPEPCRCGCHGEVADVG